MFRRAFETMSSFVRIYVLHRATRQHPRRANSTKVSQSGIDIRSVCLSQIQYSIRAELRDAPESQMSDDDSYDVIRLTFANPGRFCDILASMSRAPI